VKPDKSPNELDQSELFRARLSSILDPRHALYVLGEKIDWEQFDKEFGLLYAEKVGRPGLATRLMVGLHYLKYLCDVSDERAVEGFIENPPKTGFFGDDSIASGLLPNSNLPDRLIRRRAIGEVTCNRKSPAVLTATFFVRWQGNS
jgi:Transposase domain (DUF772)